MAVYTVVIDTGDTEQDDVLEQLEELPAVVMVQFMGPGTLADHTMQMQLEANERSVGSEELERRRDVVRRWLSG